MSRIKEWDPIIQKFTKRLSKWKANMLSIGGRATLVSSVLGSLGIYFLSFFPMPVIIKKKLEAIRSKFFWGSNDTVTKLPWIAWNSIVASKSVGGIGIGSLETFNMAVLQKWRWRYVHEHHSLWVNVITTIHGDPGDLGSSLYAHIKGSSAWARIVGSINTMHDEGIIPHTTLKRKVKDGSSTKFWTDTWLCDSPLALKFPRLFRIATDKDCLLMDRWQQGWTWSWSRAITGGTLATQLEELHHMLGNIRLIDAKDEWKWCLQGEEFFTVKDTRDHIDKVILPSTNKTTRWCKFVPKKVNILVWRTLRDRIPTR